MIVQKIAFDCVSRTWERIWYKSHGHPVFHCFQVAFCQIVRPECHAKIVGLESVQDEVGYGFGELFVLFRKEVGPWDGE